MSKQKLVSYFFSMNYMLPPNLLSKIPDSFDFEVFIAQQTMQKAESITVVTESMFDRMFPVAEEKETSINLEPDTEMKTSLEVINSYVDKPKKRAVQDFVQYFKKRYKALKKILMQRADLQSAISISKALAKQEREPVAIIGYIVNINETKNGNYILELEDLTGIIKVLISNKNEEGMKLVS